MLRFIISEELGQAASTLYLVVLRDQDGDSLLLVFCCFSSHLVSSFVVDRVLDIDEKNMTYAKRNILQNNLRSRIRPLLTKPNDQLVPIDALSLER